MERKELEKEGYQEIRIMRGNYSENGYNQTVVFCRKRVCGKDAQPDGEQCWECKDYGELVQLSEFVYF